MTSVCILDYGSGNVGSVFNLFSAVTGTVRVSNEPADIKDATHLVLPGVGAFGAAMRKIRERIPLDVVEGETANGKPLLGICVGMQVMADVGTEFGEHQGLGWIPGRVDRLEPGDRPLPHVGWNDIAVARPHPLLEGLEQSSDFYYVHSYAFRPVREEDVLARTEFGETFTSVIARDRLLGVQFHPEKSQKAGLRLVRNFLGIS
jgi:imidazole glycerol-phosphate synthase subunit HisH